MKKMIEFQNYNEDDQIIQQLLEDNPELKNQFRIKRIKFALNEKQRTELLTESLSNNTHYLLIKTQLECGLRVGELVNLTINQINFDSLEIFIEARASTKNIRTWKPKTESGNRVIPISRELASELKRHVGKKTTGYVFISQKKTTFCEESITRMINQYAKKCPSIKRNIGSHSLRRTYASVLLQNKIDIGTISKRLGHKSIRVTMEYLYTIEDTEAMNHVRKVSSQMNLPRNKLENRKRKGGK